MGQKVISATTSFGTILIVKSPDDPARTPDIEKEKQLDNFYKNYLQKIRGSSVGIILDEKDTTIKNLLYKDFTLQVDSGSGKQIRNFRIVHVNSATYTFEFLYQDIHKKYAVSEKDKLFNSIRIPPDASLQSQFTSPENTTGKPPTGNNTYMTGGIVLLVVIIVVVIVIRRRKRSG